jgi:hypothetical protein
MLHKGRAAHSFCSEPRPEKISNDDVLTTLKLEALLPVEDRSLHICKAGCKQESTCS